MTDTDELIRKIVARMSSGEPFTFADVWVPLSGGDPLNPAFRIADRTIQKWRRKGKIVIDGRRGRAPLWRLKEQSHDH